MQIEAVIAVVFLVLYMLWAGIKAFFRWVTGEAQREREEEQRRLEEDRRRKEQREREEAAERQARIEAKRKFDEAILNGQFPANEVLSVLANCDGNWDDIPTNVKEAFEELLWGSCTLRDITYGDAVRLIRQRGTNRGTCSAESRESRTACRAQPTRHRKRGFRSAWGRSGMHAGRTGACVPPEDVAVAPRQAGEHGNGIKGLRHPADATNQRGVSIDQVHNGAEPCERRIGHTCADRLRTAQNDCDGAAGASGDALSGH